MRKGYLAVSGCPRSGTGLNMDIQRVAHGDEAIMGEKFPQESRKKMQEEMLAKLEEETDAEHRVRKYLIEKELLRHELQQDKQEQKYKDMNPEGFWECAFSVQGIIYRPQFAEELASVRNGKFRVVKVVSQGLLASDPVYIGQVICMIRHPRAVAKSQERLTRGFNYTDPETGEVKNAFENMVIHTPEMYIGVTVQAAQWFLQNPRIPVLFIHFEDLVSSPKTEIDKMAKFVGRGDYEKAYDVVQPKLNRSKHEDVESHLWEDAEFVYEKFCEATASINEGEGRAKANRRFKAIVRYFQDPRRAYNREKRNWRCYRSKHMVSENQCKACFNNPVVANNFKKHSELQMGNVAKHWSKEPCLFECGMDLDRKKPYLTIEESIENNWWIERLDFDRVSLAQASIGEEVGNSFHIYDPQTSCILCKTTNPFGREWSESVVVDAEKISGNVCDECLEKARKLGLITFSPH